jgi:hypothetical protein
MADQFATAVVAGTGANIDVNLGWIPDEVIVTNITASDFAEIRWLSGMANAAGIKRLTSTFTKLSTLGITPLGAAVTDTVKGFRIGVDTDLNVSAENIQYVARRALEPKR